MGGLISILICVSAAVRLYNSGHPILFVFAVVVAVFMFWSVGVMHNYASYARRDRANRLRENLRQEGALDDAAEHRLAQFERGLEPLAIPDWLSAANMLLTVIGLILLIATFFMGASGPHSTP